MFPEEMRGALEALLFVAKDPLSLEEMAEILCLEQEDVKGLLQGLDEEYDRELRGWQLVEVAGGWHLATRPRFSPYVERLLKAPQTGLTQASLETLAIVAYKQPITRLEMEEIRGVSVQYPLNNLIAKGLIQEVGRKEGVGRPILYGTTGEFLKHFGLKNVQDLPPLEAVFDNVQLDWNSIPENGSEEDRLILEAKE